MQRLLEKIREILRNRRIRMFFTRFVSLVAAIVVFITTYALVLPAITLEKTASCGIDEHQHDDSCYEYVLTCGLEESEGHHHDDSCYTVTEELECQMEEHQHSQENGCYDEEGNLICQLAEHAHDDSCYSEKKTLTCDQQESEGHQHTDACYEKVLVCDKEVHIHSAECYKDEGNAEESKEEAADQSSSVSASEDSAGETETEAASGETLPDTYVPELDPLNMEAALSKNTGFYYFHAEEGQEVPDNSTEITDWQEVKEDTELAPTDLVKMYLPYTIPAGSLNGTNPTARYRLPENIHLTDDQIKAINKNENGITAGYAESDPEYQMYLGIEAIEGDRTPDELLQEGVQEYISAVVRAENVYEDDVYKDDKYLGQDLIFTFVPYSIEKNQIVYDEENNPVSAGEKITGWFACDFRLDQIDWIEEEVQEETGQDFDSDTDSDSAADADSYSDPDSDADPDLDADPDADSYSDPDSENVSDAEVSDSENVSDGASDNDSSDKNTADTSVIAVEKTADILFVSEDKERDIQEIRRTLKLIEQKEISVSEDTEEADTQEETPEEKSEETPEEIPEEAEEYRSGSLTADGDGYRITLDYTEEAKIPENAVLFVREITAETDKEAYEACLEQAQQHVDEAGEAKSTVDSNASRFFDIEIQVSDEDGATQKIEPAAPVSVNIQIADAPAASADKADSESGSGSGEAQHSDPTVLHFAEDGVEQIDSKTSVGETEAEKRDADSGPASDTDDAENIAANDDSGKDPGDTFENAETMQIRFEAEAFSIYGVVYTVDFHWEVNGKTYDFSIPGGGFVSLEHLAEVLGIARIGENTADSVENEAVEAENASENDVYNVGEETAANENGAHVRTYEESISLNNVEVSEVTKKFVADVASVEFSSPELVWVGKVDEGTTVGRLKEANGLEVQYSAELTEEQIAEINSSTVENGDWALISVLPFMSEESLTVTMKNGDQWTVKVTDAQISTHVITADGEDFIITVTYGPEAGIPDGATLEAEEIPEGTEAYTKYLDEALAKLNGMTINDETEDEILQHTIENARFFDISIMADGKKIEPRAPVSVEITYANMELAWPLDMNVVHFADSGIELISADTSISEEEGVHVSFEQDSFSVTGTIVDYTSIVSGEYYIVHQEGQNWYALASDGNYVNVTDNYNASSSSISGYSGSKNISWEVSTSGTGYVIKSKGENKYITLNGSVVGSTSTVLNLHAGSTSSRNARITIDDTYTKTDWGVVSYNTYDIPYVGPITVPVMGFIHYPASYYKKALGWDNRFTVNSSSPYDYWGYTNYYSADATNVQFAKLSNDSDILPGDYPNNTYNEAQLEKWLEQAMNENPLKEVSKIGYVSDYDNRIYKIDFSAKSGVLAMASDISLAFVTDVSNSMLFPSSLTPVTTADFTNSNNTFSGEINLNSGNLDKLKHNNNQVYYAIGNKSGTSTVYALYYSDGWKAMDASYYARWKAKNQEPDSSHGAKSIGTSNTTLSSDSSGTKYTIFNANAGYAAGIASGNIYNMALGNMGNRLYYLEYSVDSAVKDLKTIAKEYPLGAVYVGLETFAGKNDNDSVKNRVPYTQIGGLTNTSGSSYDTNYQTIFNALKSIEGQDGTRQDVALSDSTFFGTYNANTNTFSGGYINSGNIASTKKYVVLITDGAPNPADKKQNVIDMANRLKAAGINVITIGLSVEDVTIAPEMLWKSASSKTQANPPDSDRDRLFYWAKSGDDLTWILRDIVRSVMKEATVSATITDEIDDLFYPVDIDGKPLGNGDWIDINGKKVSQTDPSRAGKITFNSTKKTYTVTWQNQDASWDGWKGSIYVKAKEDFMGGNNVNTNVQASVVPESYTVGKGTSNSRTGTFSESAKQAKKVEPATPYVNVDELHMTQNNSEWTVYLGTNVDPEEQLKALWNKIDVNTVVKTGGLNTDYTIKNENNMYYGAGGAEDKESPTSGVETIPLSHYISLDVLTDETTGLLKLLRDGKTESTVVSSPISYAPYGQGEVGTFIVSITKRVNDEAKSSAPAAHNTEKVSEYDEVSSKYLPVETYSLSIQYVPKSEADRKTWLVEQNRVDANDENYQNHGGHGMAKEALESTSENTHKISVFAKKLTITKVDQTNTAIRNSGVVFKLYRKAQTGETPLDSANVPSGLPTGSYVLADTLTVDAEGKVTTNIDISRLPGDEPYYLVETKAPDGYIALPGALEVRAAINDEVWTKVGTSTQPLTSSTKWNPYVLSNREHKATILVSGTGELSNYAVREGNIIYDQTLNGISYRIRNNAGVELPATGGPGTTLFYLLGLLLTGLAGACLVMRTMAERADYGN